MPSNLDACGACRNLQKCHRDLEKCSTFQKSFEPPQQSFIIAAWARQAHHPGQIPGNKTLEQAREAQRLMDTPPRADVANMMMEHTGPVLTPAKIVDNLGMNPQQQLQWSRFLADAAISSPNEIVLRQSLFQKFQNERLDPGLRSAIFQRAMSYVRDVRKSLLEVFTPDELRKARQVTPVGGMTPGGYRKVAEDQYVKEGAGRGRAPGQQESLESKTRAKTLETYGSSSGVLAYTKTGKPIQLHEKGTAAVKWWGKELYAKTEKGHEHLAPKVVKHEGEYYVRAGHNSDTGSVSYQQYHPERHLLDKGRMVAFNIVRHDTMAGTPPGGIYVVMGQPKYGGGDLPKEIDDPIRGKLKIRGFNSDTKQTYYHLAKENEEWNRVAETPAPYYHSKDKRQMNLFGGDEKRPKPMVAPTPPEPAKPDFSAAQEYAAQISNPAKKKYATQYLKWMEGGEEGFSPDAGKLRPEVAQTVRAMLRQSGMGKSRRFVIYPDRLQKCGKCQGGPRAILRKPIRRADVLRKPNGELADAVEEGDEELEQCMKAGQRKRIRR